MFGRKRRQQEIIDRLVDLRFRHMQLDDKVHVMAVEARMQHRENMEAWRDLMQNQQQYNEAIADLTAKVKAQTDIDTSAVALIVGFKDQLNAIITRNDGLVDVSQLQNLASALDVGTRALADAITANTTPASAPAPAAPAADPAPAVDAASVPSDPNAPAS